MKRLILTISEARQLQRLADTQWPGPYEYRMSVSTPEVHHAYYDDARMIIAYGMTEQGCSEQHIKEQMNWKPGGLSVKTLLKRYWASRENC